MSRYKPVTNLSIRDGVLRFHRQVRRPGPARYWIESKPRPATPRNIERATRAAKATAPVEWVKEFDTFWIDL